MNPEDIEPFFEFHEECDMLKKDIKEEVRAKVAGILADSAKPLAKLLLSAARKSDAGSAEKISRHLDVSSIPSVMKILSKYGDEALEAGIRLGRHVTGLSKAENLREGKSWDVWRRILRRIGDLISEEMADASDRFVLDASIVLRRLLRNRIGEESLSGTAENALRGASDTALSSNTGTYLNEVSASSESYVFRVADSAMRQAFAFEDISGSMRWVTFFTKSCPDCVDRHGMVKTYSEWQREGLPRSGATVCRQHCHCVLVPEEYRVQISAPVMRRESAIREEVRLERRAAREERANRGNRR